MGLIILLYCMHADPIICPTGLCDASELPSVSRGHTYDAAWSVIDKICLVSLLLGGLIFIVGESILAYVPCALS